MFLFSNASQRAREREVHKLLVALVNNHCEEVEQQADGPRLERRVRLTVPVRVVPFDVARPCFERTFSALTREFSSHGVTLVATDPLQHEPVIVGLKWNEQMWFLKGAVKHQSAIGAGYWQLGVQLKEVVAADDWPELQLVQV